MTRTVLTSAIVTGVVVAVVSAALMAFAFTSMTPADWAPEAAAPGVFSLIAAGGLVIGVMFVIGTNIGAVIGLLIAAIRREVWPVRQRQPHPRR